MNLNRYLIVFDYETTGLDVNTCDIVQIGAVPIDLSNIKILEDQSFNVIVKPDGFGAEYIAANQEVFDWHAKKRNMSLDEVAEFYGAGIKEKYAWERFVKFCSRYNMDGSMEGTAIPSGQNITGFDLPISRRLAKKYKTKYPFDEYYKIDLRDVSKLWFMFSSQPPTSFGLDTLREYFGIELEGAHDALNDCLATCKILRSFLNLHKSITPEIPTLNGEKGYYI